MTPELYQRLKPFYDAALDLPAEERKAFAAKACGNDTELRTALEQLLAADETGTGGLSAPFISFKDFAKKQTFSAGDLVFDRFRIVRFIDAGGMGEVYEAEDSYLRGVHVALKTILPEIAANPQLRRRFEHEVLLAREVSHSNLCPIYDIFHNENPPPGHLFLTMKLLPGQTLARRLRLSPQLTTDEGLTILRQASLGVAAIHAAGIVHRDIKPNNIMVHGSGSDLRLWITDFGLARAFETDSTLSSVGTIAGTPGYIAPELYLGHPPSQASDLFALGVVLHEIFTGEKPHPIANSHSCTVSPKLAPPKVPALTVRLITEFLNDDPQRRRAIFADALEVIDSQVDRTNYTAKKKTLWTRRRFATTAAAGVCAVGAGAWWKREDIENAWHPLPQKRFVALLKWPKTLDVTLAPTVAGITSTIKRELSRFEANDRDLYVISPEDADTDLSQKPRLEDICGSLGANLALAVSGIPGTGALKLVLQLFDSSSGRVLRDRTLQTSSADLTSLPRKAVEVSAALLNLPQIPERPGAGPGTHSPAAFAAFQAAEALLPQANDSGLEAAIDKYKEALTADSRYAKAYARLGVAYNRLSAVKHDPGALELARRNCQTAIDLDPNLVDSYFSMAQVFADTGQEEAALQEFKKALTIDPVNPTALIWEGQLYTKLNRWADAERTLRRALADRPNSWIASNELGLALNNQGKHREAIQMLRSACLSGPGNSLPFCNLGAVYSQVGDFALAVTNLKKSLSLRPNSLAAQNLSAALRAQGNPTEALPFARKATDLDSANDSGWLELGDCYTALSGHQDEAKKAYENAALSVRDALNTDPSDGASWMQLALYEVKSGVTGNALALIAKAESLGAGDIDSQLSKVRILELLGHRDAALATLQKCFHRGATDYQVLIAPDLRSLQNDPRYKMILQDNTVA